LLFYYLKRSKKDIVTPDLWLPSQLWPPVPNYTAWWTEACEQLAQGCYTPFTWSSKHWADIEQKSSKYEACTKHSPHEANIQQTSSKHWAGSSS